MNKPVWISHRGLSAQHDENSLQAFSLAVEAGFSWLETDLHSCSDQHIVLCHDSELSRVSAVSGHIADMTRRELTDIRLKQGEKLLFLDEFMTAFAQCHWVFDIKPATEQQTITLLKEILRNKPDLLTNITFLFWSKTAQQLLLEDFPQAMCFPREDECYRAGLSVLSGLAVFGGIRAVQIYSLTPRFLGLPVLNQRIVRSFHRRGAQVLGYLPETQREIQQCLTAGVDYILSNHPPDIDYQTDSESKDY